MPSKKSVYILATGGTISMHKTVHGYVPDPGQLEKALNKLPELKIRHASLHTTRLRKTPPISANILPTIGTKSANIF